MSGNPPGTPDRLAGYSWHGALLRLLPPVRRAGQVGWAVYSALTSVAFAGAFVLASVGFGQVDGFVGLAGLFQRVAVVSGFDCLTVLAIHSLSEKNSQSGSLR